MKIRLFFQLIPSIREVETLIQVARLYGYFSVAEKMGIKTKTVEKNVMSIKSKMISSEMFGAMIEVIRQDV